MASALFMEWVSLLQLPQNFETMLSINTKEVQITKRWTALSKIKEYQSWNIQERQPKVQRWKFQPYASLKTLASLYCNHRKLYNLLWFSCWLRPSKESRNSNCFYAKAISLETDKKSYCPDASNNWPTTFRSNLQLFGLKICCETSKAPSYKNSLQHVLPTIHFGTRLLQLYRKKIEYCMSFGRISSFDELLREYWYPNEGVWYWRVARRNLCNKCYLAYRFW